MSRATGMDRVTGVVGQLMTRRKGPAMNESTMSVPGTTAESLEAATDEPMLPPEAAAALTAAGVSALSTTLTNRWALAGVTALAALAVGALLVRAWRGPLTNGA